MTISFRKAFLIFGLVSVYANMTALADGHDEQPDVIYGDDDRVDPIQSQLPALVAAARSTAILVTRDSLRTDPNNARYFRLHAQSLSESMGVCETERFASQPTAGFCSGFLVAPDIIATAGHCVAVGGFCEQTGFVFGFAVGRNSRQDPTKLPKTNVYYCQEIISQKFDESNEDPTDFALIRLDRPVTGRTPLAIRRSGDIAAQSPVAVVGYPSGLPVKISAGATVRDAANPIFFVTNLDTFGGNSGSAVVNVDTNTVEGILVRGEDDYTFENGCMVPKVCAPDECRGEEVTKTSLFAEDVPVLRLGTGR